MKKTCLQCSAQFEITESDLAFYEKVSPIIAGKRYDLPPPTLCPHCRQQRRLAWRNERRFYYRTCDKTGKKIISIYAPDAHYKVYEQEAWFADDWDGCDAGREIDFSKPFFEQFEALLQSTPLIALLIGECENCDFTNYSFANKNCYLLSASDYNQDCYYSSYLFRSRSCVDCLFTDDCELCYECVDCEKCYRTFFGQRLKQCVECLFCSDCQACKHCIGCMNLRQKEYYIFNKPCTKEEYEDKKRELTQTLQESRGVLEQMMLGEKLRQPHRFANILNCQECTGDNLVNCKNCIDCYDLLDSEDCMYIVSGVKARDCMDVNGVPDGELLYECAAIPTCSNSNFCASSWVQSNNLLYSYLCRACSNCFGCVSLHRKQYCILNKQYTKEEYEKLLPRLIEHMQKGKEWGEFFPVSIAPFSYNETVAQEFFPLSMEEVRSLGWNWHEDETEREQYLGPPYAIPGDISNISDDIIKQILKCESTGKPYRIIPQELKFYREMDLPIPRFSPDERHRKRTALRNPRKLWDRACAACGKSIQTTYAPDRPEIVYCEECYLSVVY